MTATTKTGSYVGTAAAINIELGFVPDYVLIWNESDGDAKWEWFKGMANASALQTVAAGTLSKITANGVTPYAGAQASKAIGFTVGTALSESTKTFRYLAVRDID